MKIAENSTKLFKKVVQNIFIKKCNQYWTDFQRTNIVFDFDLSAVEKEEKYNIKYCLYRRI